MEPFGVWSAVLEVPNRVLLIPMGRWAAGHIGRVESWRGFHSQGVRIEKARARSRREVRVPLSRFLQMPLEGTFKKAHTIQEGYPCHIPLVPLRVPTKGIYQHP